MATKAIPVVAAKVAATLSDFPAYIKPSAMTGWGSLTLAEAQSIRFYSDSGLTTELAREVVSADEIHVKVPSLTTTLTIYADYDGVRSDYATSATYGRDAVWANGYYSVHHMESTSYIDSTGNAHDGTNDGSTTVSGQMGNAGSFTRADSDNVDTNDNYGDGGDGITSMKISAWVRPDTLASGFYTIASKSNGATPRSWVLRTGGNGSGHRVVAQLFTSAGSSVVVVPTAYDAITSTTEFSFIGQKWDGSRLYVMVNAVEGDSEAITSIETSTAEVVIGAYGNLANAWSGDIDEVRIEDGRSNDWWTTEYNNQSDVGAFWGTVTDAGGGAAPFIPKVSMIV